MIWVFQFDEQSFDADNSFAIVCNIYISQIWRTAVSAFMSMVIHNKVYSANKSSNYKSGDISIDSGWILLNTTW